MRGPASFVEGGRDKDNPDETEPGSYESACDKSVGRGDVTSINLFGPAADQWPSLTIRRIPPNDYKHVQIDGAAVSVRVCRDRFGQTFARQVFGTLALVRFLGQYSSTLIEEPRNRSRFNRDWESVNEDSSYKLHARWIFVSGFLVVSPDFRHAA